jgi:hypothetical protein
MPHLYFVVLCLACLAGGLFTTLYWLLARAYRALRRRRGPSIRVLLGGIGLLLLGPAMARVAVYLKGATVAQTVVDVGMLGAYRSSRPGPELIPQGYMLLAGDLHCHVSPPDEAYHASRGLADTVKLARSEHLDFVGLTPHVWTKDLVDPERRARLLAGHRDLVARLARTDTEGVLFTVGAESTDDSWGHVAMLFGDFDHALEGVTDAEVAGDLSGFFTRHVDSGGLLFLNHPLLQPVDIPLPGLGLDISWRPFTAPRQSPPPHITTVDRLAVGVEASNLLVSALRDVVAFHDSRKSARDVLARLDQEILRRGRRLSPVGGTDSHSYHLRPMVFVLATERTLNGVRDAIVAGRVCVRDAAACTFEIRRPEGAWHPVGSSLLDVDRIEVRVGVAPAEVMSNGVLVGRVAPGAVTTLPVSRGECTLVRVVAGGGFSGVVYANCPFAAPHTAG